MHGMNVGKKTRVLT